MIEKVFHYTQVDRRSDDEKVERKIEKLVDDDNLALNHMILVQGTGVPVHVSNSNAYMIIVRGTMTIALDDEPANEHATGEILAIPFNTKMQVTNEHPDVLEFFVVKAPNPRDMPAVKQI